MITTPTSWLAERLQPFGGYINLILIVIAVACIAAAFSRQPVAWKVFLAAYLLAP